MVKPGYQRQKKYLKIFDGEKQRGIFGERKEKKEGKADVAESHKPATSQREITKRPREKKVTKSNKKTTGMPLL